MKHVSEILPTIYRRGAKNYRDDRDLVVSYWARTVGAKVAMHTRPVRLWKGRLVVDVDSPEWRDELGALSHQIVAGLNQALGKKVLAAIDFRVGRQAPRPPQRAVTASGPSRPRDEASEIADPHLRRLYRASMRGAKLAGR